MSIELRDLPRPRPRLSAGKMPHGLKDARRMLGIEQAASDRCSVASCRCGWAPGQRFAVAGVPDEGLATGAQTLLPGTSTATGLESLNSDSAVISQGAAMDDRALLPIYPSPDEALAGEPVPGQGAAPA